jgi:hypothetical protein
MSAGDGARIMFRNFEQSSEDAQRKMLSAWNKTLSMDDTFDRASSPGTVWLTAFQAHVADTSPAASNADGTIAQNRFYDLLDSFLELTVCHWHGWSTLCMCLSRSMSRFPRLTAAPSSMLA